jgi:hypothetical protein
MWKENGFWVFENQELSKKCVDLMGLKQECDAESCVGNEIYHILNFSTDIAEAL